MKGKGVPVQLIQSDRSESLYISLIRAMLTKVGAHASKQTLERLNYWLERVMSQLEAGRWFRAHGFPIKPAYSCRRKLYTAVARKIAYEQVLYLEFGVFQGASMRIWSELLNNPCSSLHGFDSFEGLPENWNTLHPQGTFDTKGALPTFDDSRVQLHVGWFHQTLPTFILPQHDRLILHIDVDVYSSAKFVLETLQHEIRIGTIILFDEFYDGKHELKAFDEFLTASDMVFRFLGSATSLSQCAFERVG